MIPEPTAAPSEARPPRPEPPPVPAPFVGLRAFERSDRAIFRGRDRDARLLVDKIISARLTLLYAPSGVGKSSLLRTLVLADVEDEQAIAVYHDAWTSEDPLGALKATLAARAEALGVREPALGAPTLTELVARIGIADARTVVLVLDQFEEFLIAHGQRLDPLRRELGALVRAQSRDVRVVLSLRQEHLAGLEPFRGEMLNLFQSTYQLEPLAEPDLRDALEYPVTLFGAGWDPGLIDELLRDLRGRGGGDGALELPMLQLVCEELWTAGRGAPRLSLELYRSVGGAAAILDGHVRRVMESGTSDPVLTATLLRSLAPPSGMKTSFTAEDLASITDEPIAAIRAELLRLKTFGVLREREYRVGASAAATGGVTPDAGSPDPSAPRTSLRYELLHDAFVPIAARWRDAVLHRAERRRVRRRVAIGLGLIGLLLLGAVAYDHWRLGAKSDGRFDELRAAQPPHDAPAASIQDWNARRERVLDDVADYLLRERFGPGRIERLSRLLRDNAALIPDSYGIDPSGVDLMPFEDGEHASPLTFRYSEARQLDDGYFARTWQAMSQQFAIHWGIPAPTQLRLKANRDFPRTHVELIAPGLPPLELELPAHERDVVVSARGLPAAPAEFLERLHEKKPIPELIEGGPWYAVPRWSLAAFKGGAGRLALEGSAVPAILLAQRLLAHPEPLLGPAAFELLLDRVAQRAPEVVAEARAARGERLRGDLAEVVKLGRPLTSLELILETLANHPDLPSPTLARVVVEDLSSLSTALPDRLHGPWIMDHPERGRAADRPRRPTGPSGRALAQAAGWLPEPPPPLLCELGDELVSSWVDGRALRPEVRERVDEVRDALHRRFGVDTPGVTFRAEHDLAPRAFRLALLNQADQAQTLKPVDAGGGDTLAVWADAFSVIAERGRVRWLTSQATRLILDGVDQPLRAWLAAHYSVTDLKLILRGVVAPRRQELQGSEGGPRAGALAENTVAHPAWLLGSLTFWALVDGYDLPALVEALRETQRVRLRGTPPAAERTDPLVVEGIDALGAGDPARAEAAFRRALAVDRAGAIAAFPQHYARTLAPALRSRVERACAAPTSDTSLSREERLALQERLADAARPLATDTDRRLRLCLFAATDVEHARERRRLATSLAERHPVAGWPPEQAWWFGRAQLEALDPRHPDPAVVAQAKPYLASAFQRLDVGRARTLFWDLQGICGAEGPRKWCWTMMGELAASRPEEQIPILWALIRSNEEATDSVREALAFAELAERGLRNVPPGDRRDIAEEIRIVRARASERLAVLGDPARWQESERQASPLLSSAVFGADAFVLLAENHLVHERLDRLGRLVEASADRPWFDTPEVMTQRLWAALARGEDGDADRIGARAYERAEEVSGDERPGYLLVAAMSRLLTRKGPWELTARRFINTDHQYRNYVAMMLFAWLSGVARDEARAVLEQAWARAEPASWVERLRGGDQAPWREMLVGYYLGEVDRDRIFGPLANDAAFEASEFRASGLPRLGMLCEASFYDALLAQARGDAAGARRALDAVIATDYRTYFEYRMSKFLRDRPL